MKQTPIPCRPLPAGLQKMTRQVFSALYRSGSRPALTHLFPVLGFLIFLLGSPVSHTQSRLRDSLVFFERINEAAKIRRTNLDEALVKIEQAYAIALSHADTAWLAKALFERGRLEMWLKKFDQADSSYQKAVALFQALQDTSGLEESIYFQGISAYIQGEMALADSLFSSNTSLLEHQNAPDTNRLIASYASIGSMKRHFGEPEAALQIYLKAYPLIETFPNYRGVVLNNLKTLYTDRGQLDSAALFVFQSIESFKKEKDTIGWCLGLTELANIENHLKQYNKALFHCNQAKQLYEAANISKDKQLSAFSKASIAYLGLGQLDSAFLLTQAQLHIARQYKIYNEWINGAIHMGTYYQTIGNPDSALHYFQEADAVATAQESVPARMQVLQELIPYYFSIDSPAQVETHCKYLLDLEQQSPSWLSAQIAYEYLGKVEEARNNYEKALEYYRLEQAYSDSIYSKKAYLTVQEQAHVQALKSKEAEIKNILFRAGLIQKIGTATIFVLGAALVIALIFVRRFWIKRRQQEAMIQTILEASQHDRPLEEIPDKRAAFMHSDATVAPGMAAPPASTPGAAPDFVQFQDNLRTFGHLVSHDLKRYLLRMEVQLQAAFGEAPPPERQREVMQTLRAAQRFFDKIQAFQQVEQTTLSLRKVDIRAIVEDTKAQLFQTTRTGEPELMITGNWPPVNVDPILFRQVFINLFENAVKYAKPGEVPRLEIVGRTTTFGNIVIEIKDNGIGFEQIDNIFDPFVRAEASGLVDGSGLGLAIVKKIVDLHKGKIWYQSTPNVGTSFFIGLPQGKS